MKGSKEDMIVFEIRDENYQRWSRVLGVEREEPVLVKSIHFFTKQRLGAPHNLILSQCDLSESEVTCWLARVLVHEPGPDCKGLNGLAQPTFHEVYSCEPMSYQGLTSPH